MARLMTRLEVVLTRRLTKGGWLQPPLRFPRSLQNAKESDLGLIGNLFTSFGVNLKEIITGTTLPLSWVSRQSQRVRG